MDTYDAINFIQAESGKYPGLLELGCRDAINNSHFTEEQKDDLRKIIAIIDENLGDLSRIIGMTQSISVVRNDID